MNEIWLMVMGSRLRKLEGWRRGAVLRVALSLLLMFVWHGGSAVAQETAPIFASLSGEWVGEGSLMGRSAHFTMEWQHHGTFAVLTFTNAFVDENGNKTPVLSSVAVYRTTSAHPEAIWLDTRPERVEIEWITSASELESSWKSATEEGRTTYRLISGDEVEVVDEVLSDGVLRVFGRALYTRVRPGP